MKVALPSMYAKGNKSVIKRVRNQMLDFEKLSERNAKHLYIERCHSFPGYDCTFFSVKVPPSGRFRKGTMAKQLLGISDKRVVFLDEKTKVCDTGAHTHTHTHCKLSFEDICNAQLQRTACQVAKMTLSSLSVD